MSTSDFRRVTHSTATFGDMSRATMVPPAIGDPNSDLISRVKEQERQEVRKLEKQIEHRKRYDYLEKTRQDIFALLDLYDKTQQAILDDERRDSELFAMGESLRSEIRNKKRRYNTEWGRGILIKERLQSETLFLIKPDAE